MITQIKINYLISLITIYYQIIIKQQISLFNDIFLKCTIKMQFLNKRYFSSFKNNIISLI